MFDHQKRLLLEKKLAKYEIIKELGRGGMGVVYAAYDSKLQRKVAIKVILKNNTVSMQRFAKEAQIIASFDHPNIVRLYELDPENQSYIVLQHIDGEDLTNYLQKNQLDRKQKVQLFVWILSAVNYAHKKGVIHRDIKPSNILIDKKGSPYLMDFGIAKEKKTNNKSLTKTGMILGSAGYMSPEQAQGDRRNVTHQSDIFSLGIILYELLTNKSPIEGKNQFQLMFNLVNKDVIPPRKLDKSISENFNTICIRALERKAKNRYLTSEDMLADIELAIKNKPILTKKKWKIPIHFTIFIILIITTSITLFIRATNKAIQNNTIENVQTDPLGKVKRWFDLGYYEEAEKELRNVTTEEYDKYMAMICARKKNIAKYKNYYEKLSAKEKLSSEIFIAQAEILLEQEKTNQAQKILQNQKKNSFSNYYLGKIFYEKGNYLKAFSFFKKIESLPQHDYFVFQNERKMYLAKCLFHLKKYKKAKAILEKLKEKKNSSQVYFWLAKAERQLGNLKKAQNNIMKSLQQNTTADAYVELGNIFSQQEKKTREATEAYLKAQSLNSNNIEAFEGYAKVAFSNIAHMEEYNYSLLFSVANYRYYPPDLLKTHISKIVEVMKPVYQQIIFLRDTKTHEKLTINLKNVFHSDLYIKKIAQEQLMLMRYHNDFEATMENLIKKKPKLTQLYEEILHQKDIDSELETKFLLHYSYLKPFAKISDHFLEKCFLTLKNSEESLFTRYLAARILFLQQYFEEIFKFTQSPQEKIICSAVLQEMGLEISFNKTYFDKKILPEDEIIIAKSYTKKLILQSKQIKHMLQNSNPLIAIPTAKKYFSTPSWSKKARETLSKFMKSHNSQYKENAFYSYAIKTVENKPLSLKEIASYETILHRSLKTGNQATIAAMDIFINMKHNFMKNKIRDAIYNSDVKFTKILPQVSLINFWANNNYIKQMKNFYQNASKPPLLRALCVQKHLFSFLEILKKEQQPDVSLLTKDRNKIVRSYGYSIKSIIHGDILKDLAKETNPNIKAALILYLTLGEGVLEEALSMILAHILEKQKKTKAQKLEVIQKYLNNPHPNLKYVSNLAYAFLLKNQERQSFIQKTLDSKDLQSRLGVARALFFRIRDTLGLQDRSVPLLYVSGTIPKDMYTTHLLELFEKEIDLPQKMKSFEEKLSTIYKLDKNVSEYILFYSYLKYKKRETTKAIHLLEQSIKKNPNFILNYIFLAEISNGQKQTNALNKIYQHVRTKYIPPLCLKNLAKIGHPIIFKILKQNYLRIVLKKNTRDLDKDKGTTWFQITQYCQQYRKETAEIYRKCTLIPFRSEK